MDDQAIVDLYWARSEQAIGETAAKYGPYCMKISMNILRDPQESEENVNDTYFQAWNAMPPHRPAGLTAFLGRIARNLALNRYKAGRAAKRGAGEPEFSLDELDECVPDAMAVEDAVHGRALSDAISAFLWKQNPEARRMFVRRYFHCEPVGELARTFGVSESKVKSMLFRTRNKLRLYLESEGYIHEK